MHVNFNVFFLPVFLFVRINLLAPFALTYRSLCHIPIMSLLKGVSSAKLDELLAPEETVAGAQSTPDKYICDLAEWHNKRYLRIANLSNYDV